MKRKKRKNSPERDIPEIIIKPLPKQIRQTAADIEKNVPDTPDRILRNTLIEIYGIDARDRKTYKKFVTNLMRSLSLLVTAGKDENTFEPDFDKFFTMIVHAINECGEMLELLQQYGIEYVPKWLKQEEDEENGEED